MGHGLPQVQQEAVAHPDPEFDVTALIAAV
jgi:hypothetical protein